MERDETVRSKHTEEFRKQAVELSDRLGNVAEAARQLGIEYQSLVQWRMKRRESELRVSSAEPLSADEKEELKRLRKKVTELEQANYILKRATAFFSQDLLK